MKNNKTTLVFVLLLVFLFSSCQVKNITNNNNEVNQNNNDIIDDKNDETRAKITINSIDDIDYAISIMTLEEKVGQMIQAERNGIQMIDVSGFNIGSILSGGGSSPNNNNVEGWSLMSERYQKVSRNSSSSIPIVYGVDAVHGHNNVDGATIFPHNIGLGATNDEDLMYQIGKWTAKEVKATGLEWNFSPSVSVVQDIRWGRSYESFSEDANIVSKLAVKYIMGLQDNGVMATTKHFIGDGFTDYGTGEGENLIDRGDVDKLSDKLLEINLPVYEEAIKAGTASIMVSYNSVQGIKMHERKDLITDILKNELGFEGVVISDWEAIRAISGNLEISVVKAVNAGIDMLMEPYGWKDVYNIIIDNVKNGNITQERIDDAVKRILTFKYRTGVFTEGFERKAGEIGSDEAREVAREAVSKSLVLLKNNDILPISKDKKIYLLGPAIDNVGIQCGGWTLSWQGEMEEDLMSGTSIKDAFLESGFEITDDITKADLVVLAIGEKPYTEMVGDTNDLSLDGPLSLEGNIKAINEAIDSNKPILTIIVAGRPVLLDEYIDDFDSIVMSWLFGTEALGVIDVLSGNKPFVGKLPVTWPKQNNQADKSIYTDDYESYDFQFDFGFGLEY